MSEQRPFEVGDEVYRESYSTVMLRKIERVTKTQVIIEGGERYRQSDGRKVGGNAWTSGRIHHPTPQLDRQFGAQRLVQAARNLKRLVFEGTSQEIRAAFAAWDKLEKEVNNE